MSLLEEIVVRCTEIEQHLRALGATGTGLAELVESIEGAVRPVTIVEVRKLASVRNRFVHEHGYAYPDSPTELLTFADTLLVELRKLVGNAIVSNKKLSPASATNVRNGSNPLERPMPALNPWVTIVTAESQPKLLRLRFPSTAARRLVFFKGVFPEVPPIGNHAVPLLGVKKLARVSMVPAVTTFEITATTRDQIEFGLTIDVTAEVAPNDDAVARIAADASQGTSNELRLLVSKIVRGLQTFVSQLLFDELPDISSLQARLTEQLTASGGPALALSIVSISVRAFAATSPEIQTHNLERLRLKKRAVLKIDEEAAELRRLELERAAEVWESERQRDAREWDREHAKRVALDESAIEHERHAREREFRQMDLQAQIKLAEIQRDAEIAKATRTSLDLMVPMIIKGAMGEGERRTLADIVRKQIGLSASFLNLEPTESTSPTPPDTPPPLRPDNAQDK